MAEVVANVAFWHGGHKVRVGDVFDTAHDLYTLFPSRFTARYSADAIVVGTVGTSAGTLGSLIAKRAVLDANGTVVGYEPIYSAITP